MPHKDVFPYGILFRETPEPIAIIALMHLHRGPGYWRRRENEEVPCPDSARHAKNCRVRVLAHRWSFYISA